LKIFEKTIKNQKLKLQVFDIDDIEKLEKILLHWRNINDILKEFPSRLVNTPEVLSEGIFCFAYGIEKFARVIKGNSYDVVDLSTGDGIQVKSTTVEKDLTSFGPNTQWDKLYFVDFYGVNSSDDKIKIYLIDSKVVYKVKVNKEQTFGDQQKEKRRPRFSIKQEIIGKKGILPDKEVSINELKKC